MTKKTKHVEWDVIVVGGGPAGCAAALAAARRGIRVLLVEAGTCLGGMGTAGLVPTFAPFSDGKHLLYGGIAREVLLASRMEPVCEDNCSWHPIHAESLKVLYESLLLEAGVTIQFGQIVCAAEREEERISHVSLAGKGGLRHLSASVFIDATGDGDLAAHAGCAFEQGDENGELQPATYCFVLAGVREAALSGTTGDAIGLLLQTDDEFPDIRSPHCCMTRLGNSIYGFNAGHIWKVNPSDPNSYTESLVSGRQIALQYQQGLSKHFPEAFGDALIVGGASLLGVRETRRIVGEKTLTFGFR